MEVVNDEKHEIKQNRSNERDRTNELVGNGSKDCIVRQEVPFRFDKGRSDERHGIDEVIRMHEELGSDGKAQESSDGQNPKEEREVFDNENCELDFVNGKDVQVEKQLGNVTMDQDQMNEKET